MAIGFIIGFILLAALLGAGYGAFMFLSDHRHRKVGVGVLCTVVAVVSLIAFIVVPFSFHTIESGQVAVVKHLGKVDDTERTAGTHFDLWVTDTYVVYDATVQTADLVFSAYSADAQTMDVTMTLQYQIIADKASDIATQYGVLATLQNRITSIAIEKAKSELSTDKAMDIIANRAQMSPRVEQSIKAAIGEHYFVNVVAVVLTDITFTDAFEKAVEEKMIAEQNKLKAEYENQTKIQAAEAQAKADKTAAEARAEAEKIAAEAKIAIAKSEAKAILTKANAEAEALGIQALEVARMLGFTEVVNGEEQIKSNLSLEEAKLIKAYIEYIKYMEAWDGVLPDTVVGDNAGVILPAN